MKTHEELQDRIVELEAQVMGLGVSARAQPPDAQSWLAAIVESSDDAILSKDLQGTITSWNPAAERLFGYRPEEIIGQSVLRLIPPDLHGEEPVILAKVRRGELVDHFETTRLSRDGRRIPVTITVSPIRDPSGQIIGASKILRDVSSMREADRAQAVLAAIVRSSDDAIISKDLDGIVTSWNHAAEKLYGYKAEEMIGKPIRLLIPQHLQGEEDEILAKIRAGERIDHFETVRTHRSGSMRHVSITVSPIRDSTGRVIGASKIARDIGELREAQRTKGWLAAIVESSDDAILSKDLNGTITSWNPAAQRLFGYRAEEIVGESVLRLIPPDLRHEEDMIIGNIRAGKRVDHYETTRMRKDGSRMHVTLTVSPIRDARGTIIGASKILRDVTRMREADRAQGVLAAIVRSSDDAIISKDLEGVVTSWNDAAERLYGYTAAEMVGRPLRDVIPPELQPEEDDILQKIRRGERVDHFETQRLHKDGTRRDVSITVSPIVDSAGRVIGASKIARDISDQREAQRRKDQFLAILAHELRNPLAPVRNAIMLIKQPALGPEQRARAHEIAERQIEHMARLLDDLLDVARISTGRVELKRTRVELRPLVAHAVEAARVAMEAKRHQLVVHDAAEPLWLEADPVRITQIFTNLLNNSSKYTDPGGRIEIATRREGPWAVVEVRDNGIGFAPGAAPGLFQLFAQDASGSLRAAGGLGIGLALVREFVERHGGSVRAESQGPGQGSTFTVRLPCLD